MILTIDSDRATQSSLVVLLEQAGYSVTTAEESEAALRIAHKVAPELFLLNLNLSAGGWTGPQLLKALRAHFPSSPVILIADRDAIGPAIEARKAGAADYVTSPWNKDHLLQVVRTILSLSAVESAARPPADRAELDCWYDFSAIVGHDPALVRVLDMAGRVSATDAPVLILGESGTGKELIAEAIHNNSPRRGGPFVKLNLAGSPGALFDTEISGRSKTAMAETLRDRVGRFQRADGGSIFLDEIGDLDIESQTTLLRVLEDRSFEALGFPQTRAADFRVICATSRDLEKMVVDKRFREDLYYRVNIVTLRLSPLRERPDDIPLLVRRFIDNLRAIYRREVLTVDGLALDYLKELPWPGNVRELKNLIERAALMSPAGVLSVEDFRALMLQPLRRSDASSVAPLGMTLRQMEESMIKRALEFHGSNISRVARALGLSRAALYRRLEKYGISL